MSMKPQWELELDARGPAQIRDAAPDLDCATAAERSKCSSYDATPLVFDLAGLTEYKMAQKWVTDVLAILQQLVL